jgi:hypothetical protein
MLAQYPAILDLATYVSLNKLFGGGGRGDGDGRGWLISMDN